MKILTDTKIKNVDLLYGQQDLSKWDLFKGDYINFGYWPPIKSGEITEEERIQSSQVLYRKVAEELSIKASDRVLDVGCGIGVGTCQVYDEFKPRYILGVDASKDQIMRALARPQASRKGNKIEFVQSYAEDLSKIGKKFEKVLTLEALQHFRSVGQFIQEVQSILAKQGTLVIASFLFNSHPSDQFFSAFPNFECGVDQVIVVDDLIATLQKSNFKCVKVQSIGDHVWPGFDTWIKQTEFADTWNVNWKKAFDAGILDYYVVVCKPSN